MSISSAGQWEHRVAREVAHQARIEAALDRADACERLASFQHALEWLDRAEALSGGLSPSCRVQRARCTGELARDSSERARTR